MQDEDKTPPGPRPFDFSKYPEDTLFHERRQVREPRRPTISGSEPDADTTTGHTVQGATKAPPTPRVKKERRRRIDPTTFEKQYTDDEMEFMNAMQRFKVQSGKSFPSHGDVLRVAYSLGYRKLVTTDAFDDESVCSCGLPYDDHEG